MTARIKISQVGLSAGVAGVARTDGLATGALVTLEDVEGVGASTFRLAWGPLNDTTAVSSLAATVDPDIWTFAPTAARYGSFLVELLENGVLIERRIFGIRTPTNHLLIPAFNERGSRHASWVNDGADQVELSENNATDFSSAPLNALSYAGYWRSLSELYSLIETGTAGLADHGIAFVKLPAAAAAPSVVGASVNGNLVEIPRATLSALLRGVGLTVDALGTLQVRSRPRKMMIQEWFNSGLLTSGNIGSNGWCLLGTGTPAVARISSSSLINSKITLSASNVANDRATLALGDTDSRSILTPATMRLAQVAWNFNTHTADKRVFFGLHDDFSLVPSAAVDCLGLFYDTGVNGNYLIMSRAGSVGTPVNTGVAAPSNTQQLITIWQTAAGDFQFYAGATLLGTVLAAAASTAVMNFGISVQALTTSGRTHNIGYVGLESTILTGCHDDDTFLDV